MADILGIVLPTIVDCAYDPMKRHISYAFKCKRNVNNLEEGVEALKGEQERLQHLVEDKRRNGKLIERDVDEWLGKVGVIVGKELELASERAEMKCFFGFCPNLKTLYRVSRKAEKKARELAKLQEKRRGFNRISYAAPLPCMDELPTGPYMALESRMTVSKDIIKVLTTDGVSMVGVHGIGGVGKTTLATEILRQVKEQKLFDEVVMATITKDVNVKGIQAEIGEPLGLNFDGVESVKVRARRLFGRLESGKEKKVLIILDDLWKKLDLVEVGIPSKNQLSGCKIFLTSRDLNVLSNEMDCQNNFEVRCLPEKEAWDLFQMLANNSFEEHDLRSTAIEVAKVCAGLPIAIVTVARTLKGKSLPEWKNALLKLKNIDPSTGLTPMQKTIYQTLESSYKELESELQPTFLLCSQMGYNATTGDLLKYGIGLGLFRNMTLDEAQNGVYSSVRRLKELCLLLEGGTNKELVMHDVVRDVGRWIAVRDDNVLVVSDENKREWSDADKLKTCTRIWIFGSVDEVPEEMHCPKLFLAHVDGKDGSLTVPDNLFKGLHKLKVLSFTSFTFSSLPSSLCLLKNLKTLCFHQSMELEGVSIIGKLTKLEVLSFAESNITHLPVEIGQLTKLRLLDLSGCRELEMIPPNILSRLYQLEELYMGNSFDRWTVEGQETQDTASLGELKHLVSLTNLEISIPDAQLVSEDIFPKKLCRYKIFIGGIEDWNKECRALTNLKLKLNANLQIEKGMKRLVKKSEDLYLDRLKGVKNFVYDLDNDGVWNNKGFPKLKHLHLRDSPEVQYLAEMTKVAPPVAFPVLESLYLEKLISLEKIYQSRITRLDFLGGPVLQSFYFFSKLRIINVNSCDRLTHLFLFSVAQGLSQLKEIKVDSCASLETVVAEASEVYSNSCDATNVIEFSQLESLTLECLPKLTSFYSDGLSRGATNLLKTNVNEDVKISMPLLNHKIFLPNLKKMDLYLIDNMETLWHGQLPAVKNSFQNLTELTLRDCNSLVTIAPSSASFKNLTTLAVSNCSRLLSLVTASTAQSLGQLINFEITNCKMMTEIIDREGDGADNIIFTKLQCLVLVGLQSLTSFCSGDHTFSFPSLKEMTVENCPKMRVFCAGHISTPKLHKVYLEQYGTNDERWEGNLNSTIQKLYIEKNQAVLMSNQAESSKQPNLNAEDAQQQNSGTCDVSGIISNDQDQAMAQSVHQSSMTQPNIDHIETDEPRDIKTFEVSEGSTSDELHTSKSLNESNSLEIVEEGIVTGSYAEPEMTQIASTRQIFHFTVDDKEATPDQGARHMVASGVVTPLPASELSHLSQDNYLKCIRTPDDHFMDSSFAQNAIELFEWKINADRDHPGACFLAELVDDLKQLHTSEENLSLGANPPMRTNDHKNTLGKCIEELNEVHEKIQEYEKVLGDLKQQRQKLLQRRTSLFKREKLFEAVKIDLCATVKSYFGQMHDL